MLLEVEKLKIEFQSDKKNQLITAVDDLSFHVDEGEILGIVGESGSGKSITNLAIMNLLSDNAKISASKIIFDGQSLLNLKEKNWQQIRGKKISMIFQDPMTALNPFLTIEYQLVETIVAHLKLSKKEAIERASELLSMVGISSPKERLKTYPFELSGGMAQRVMIAMAISTNPKLLIADEPTTALDVTIQKQILDLLKSIQEKTGMSIILVTHDLSLVSEYSDRIQVMYAGNLVESNFTNEIIKNPMHPYTKGLLESRPGGQHVLPKTELNSIKGVVPLFHERPSGCQFHPRCNYKTEACEKEKININPINNGLVRCLNPIAK